MDSRVALRPWTSAAFPAALADDAALLRRVAGGDMRAFEALYRAYQPRLNRFLTVLIRRPRIVEEVLDDTLLVVWRRPESFSGASRLSTWIMAIAYRKAMSALRGLDEPVEDPDAAGRASQDVGPEDDLGRRQVQAILRAAVGGLSADHRAVVELTYFHEMTYGEIAEIMACPVDTVKTRMFHARRHLRRALAGRLSDWL